MGITVTSEQQTIINHPLGQHARVLAVAGSGKTTTMVQRVQRLVTDLNQSPQDIRIVMFNRMARQDFEDKLARAIPVETKRPKVLTFHALAYRLQEEASKKGLLPRGIDLWIGDKEDLSLICMHRAIDSLVQQRIIREEVDPDEAMKAVGHWKASLIPPERAGHRTNPDLVKVYRRFEELRIEKQGLTFDDFVPTAFNLINSHPEFQRQWTNRIDHLIVDEYQDINYGQQQLIRLLAGTRADVMIVGDDDQTIYEWRSARPHYILAGFKEDFANKPLADYKLSHSFRFGPLLAQAAHNTITFNEKRAAKPLAAHDLQKNTGVTILSSPSLEATDLAMAQELVTLVKEQKVPPTRIIVLARLYVQMEGLQAILLRRGVPYRVIGMNPFHERDENRTLVDYLRLALALDDQPDTMKPWRSRAMRMDEDASENAFAGKRRAVAWPAADGRYGEAVRSVLAIANKPSRKLPRKALQEAIEDGGRRGLSIDMSLRQLALPATTPLNRSQCTNLSELLDFLRRVQERVHAEPGLRAGDLLWWIIKYTGYLDHFADYYGQGEGSFERAASVQNFMNYATTTGKMPLEFIEHLKTLDTTHGKPADQVTMMTTIYRTKGLEYDYVFVPSCVEGYMPVMLADENATYDTEEIVPDNPPSPPIESERRLFYVAITRAVKRVYVGTVDDESAAAGSVQSPATLPSRFLEEMQLGPTRAIVEALQKTCATQQTMRSGAQPSPLCSTLATLGRQRALASRVVENYADILDSKDLTELQQLVGQFSANAFSYTRAYRGLAAGNGGSAAPGKPSKASDPWADLDIRF